MKVYRRIYDNPLYPDGSEKPNDCLGVFEIVDEVYVDDYASMRIGKKDSIFYAITEYEVTGSNGGSRFEVHPLTNLSNILKQQSEMEAAERCHNCLRTVDPTEGFTDLGLFKRFCSMDCHNTYFQQESDMKTYATLRSQLATLQGATRHLKVQLEATQARVRLHQSQLQTIPDAQPQASDVPSSGTLFIISAEQWNALEARVKDLEDIHTTTVKIDSKYIIKDTFPFAE